MTSALQVGLVVNPVKLHASRAIERVRAACAEAGWPEPMVRTTTLLEPGAAQARALCAAGASLVIAAGGDGTVREVATALAGGVVPLAVLPLGTGNLLARNLGLRPGQLGPNITIALHGVDGQIDVGRVTVTQELGVSEHIFLVMAGIGLDARVVGSTRAYLKRRLGWIAYGEAAARHLFARSGPISVTIDGAGEQHHIVQSVLVGNCPRIPGGLRFFPAARYDDGVLDVVIVAPRTPLGWIPIAGQVLTGRGRSGKGLQYHPARTISLRPLVPAAMQLDGDVLPNVQAALIRIDHHALQIRLPHR